LPDDVLQKRLLAVPEFVLPEVEQVRAIQLGYAQARESRARGKQAPRDPVEEARVTAAADWVRLQARDAGLPVVGDDATALDSKAAETLGRGAVDLRWSARAARKTGQPTLMTARLEREENGQVSILEKNTGRTITTERALPRSALRSVGELRTLFEVTWPGENVEKMFDVVPVIEQVLQVEGEGYRRLLVEELARIPGRRAGTALARRALYDPSAEIRRAARVVLGKRPADEFREVALNGFEYPWAPVAVHAAQILLDTNDVRAVPDLVRLLDQSDPARPYWDEKTKRHAVRELVRINHMRNCCLCHAPSYSGADWVPGRIMEPGKKIPEEYYGSLEGAFVRADVTYLRPNFSAMQPVEDAAPWPTIQRFDYLVRTRPATAVEVAQDQLLPARASYPHREAVLMALRGLTGKDVGTETESWHKYAREMSLQ
jgi:hypothetical protein